jgi:uncharacterized membrane protein (DUF4010 family)
VTDELAARLGLALAIGLLVGLERGWRERNEPDRSRTAGIRTYGISGLLGGVVALLSDALGAPSILTAGFVVYTAVLTLYKLREAVADEDYSVTAVVAGMAVFALGALAVIGDYVIAAAGGTALAAVLASREVLHEMVRRLTWEELRAALILAVMTAIVLPILPDRTIDPWNGVNPRQIWLFTILVAALSYAGYVATRLLGAGRGLLAGSLLGAVVSSTATTVALARRSGDAPAATAGAAALAATVSICRVCVIVAVVAPSVLADVALPALAAAAIFAAAGATMLLRATAGAAGAMEVRNPFDLMPLLGFAVGFAVVAAASAYLTATLGATGMLATSAISAMFDVDVAVLSAARQVATPLGGDAAGRSAIIVSILLALLSNATGRAGLAAMAGSLRFSGIYVSVSLLAAATGFAVYILAVGGRV